jgi:hypothetical protein
MGDIRNMAHLDKHIAFYFRQGYFLTNEMIEQLFDSFDKLFNPNSTNSSVELFNFSLSVIDNTRFDASKNSTIPYEFAFTIKSKAEFEYARMLRNAYKHTVEPYFVKNKVLINKLAHNFDRVFILTGGITNDRNGKTIHNTNSTFDLSIHTADSAINPNRTFVDYKSGSKYHTVPHNYGHLSHFRSFFNFKYKLIPISSLFLDLNYFKCYFLPIIEQFSKDL